MTAKTRPVLVVSVDYGDADRAIVTVVPHTTAVRQSLFEILINVPFLRPGAFLVLGGFNVPQSLGNPKAWRDQTRPDGYPCRARSAFSSLLWPKRSGGRG